ncbi:MAG TPA: MaoC family dehydratase [Solirubrobacterales bacterium]|nr:MaoC family dehydratase [Solirubrobacterales bacterium]
MSAVGEWSEEHGVDVTTEQIVDYARATGEDVLRFEQDGVAPPMFAVIYAAPAVWRTVLGCLRGEGPVIHAAQELEWFAPVRAGDRIATRARLDHEAVDGGKRTLRFRSVSHNGGGELVSRGLWTVLVPEGGL